MIVELQFGAGGTDSKLFVDDLSHVYERYSANLGLKCEIVHSENGHALLHISGKDVYKAFQNEPGKHVVQRVPPTEMRGRRQTSIISVAVLSLPPVSRMDALQEKDLAVIYQTGKQGAGGQNVNKVASAVRMKHLPTGLSVFINGRDQGKNYTEALRILTVRVNNLHNKTIEEEYSSARKAQLGDGGRGNKTRTYNFIDSRVVDHCLGVKTKNIKEVMKGNLGVLFNSRK